MGLFTFLSVQLHLTIYLHLKIFEMWSIAWKEETADGPEYYGISHEISSQAD